MSLYYDTDADGYDGILIAEGLPESDGPSSYVWDTQSVPRGLLLRVRYDPRRQQWPGDRLQPGECSAGGNGYRPTRLLQ